MRWKCSWGGRRASPGSVWWRCFWSWWPPASQSPPSEKIWVPFIYPPPCLHNLFPFFCRQFSAFSERRSQFRPNSLDKYRKEFIKKNLASFCFLFFLSAVSCSSRLHPSSFFSPSDWQVVLARKAVKARRRVTRKTANQQLTESRKLLKKLRLLAAEVRLP